MGLDISVITVSYMTGPALMESIRSVMRDPEIGELVLVDNGNRRADRQRLADMAQKYPKLRILQGQGNIGFARGCNYGARLARGRGLVFLNPDAVIERGAARALLDAGAELPKPWIVGGMLLNSWGREQRGARRGPLTFRSALAGFIPPLRALGLKSIHRDAAPLPDGPVPMPTISGAFLAMDRESFDALSGFDERYFLHVEDIEICRRVHRLGGAVAFHPGARVMHYGSTSEVTRWKVEWHKLKGFLRYFWDAEPPLRSRMATILLAPLMFAAIMGRALYLSARMAIVGR